MIKQSGITRICRIKKNILQYQQNNFSTIYQENPYIQPQKNIPCVVTGASRGIGFSTTQEQLQLGADVTMVATSKDSLSKGISKQEGIIQNYPKLFSTPIYVPTEPFSSNKNIQWQRLGDTSDASTNNKNETSIIPSDGSKIYPIVTDVSQEDQVKACYNELKENFLLPNILVNCAGIAYESLAIKNDMRKINKVMSINVFGTMNMCKEFLNSIPTSTIKQETNVPSSLSKNFLRIVNISSFIVTQGTRGLSAYAAAKGAINGYTRTLAMEYPMIRGRPLTANNISPGAVRTDMTAHLSEAHITALLQNCAIKRMAEPEEIARVIAFLCTPQASYITGQNIYVTEGCQDFIPVYTDDKTIPNILIVTCSGIVKYYKGIPIDTIYDTNNEFPQIWEYIDTISNNSIRCITLLDTKLIACSTKKGDMILIDSITGKEIYRTACNSTKKKEYNYTKLYKQNPIQQLAGTDEGQIHLYTIEKNNIISIKQDKILDEHNGCINDIYYDSINRRIYAVSEDGYLSLWKEEKKECIGLSECQNVSLECVILLLNNTNIQCGSDDGYIYIFPYTRPITEENQPVTTKKIFSSYISTTCLVKLNETTCLCSGTDGTVRKIISIQDDDNNIVDIKSDIVVKDSLPIMQFYAWESKVLQDTLYCATLNATSITFWVSPSTDDTVSTKKVTKKRTKRQRSGFFNDQ